MTTMLPPARPERWKFKERLKRWPYAKSQLYQIPEAQLVEHHALYLLCRALNIGRLTAFVGSGVSMAYGRISWNDLIYTSQETVLARYEDERKTILETISNIPSGWSRIDDLGTLLTKHRIKRNTAAKAAQQLVVLELAEDLDDALERFQRNSNRSDESLSRITGDPEKAENAQGMSTLHGRGSHSDVPRRLRSTLSISTYDDRAHAEQLILDALRDPDLAPDPRNASLAPDEIRQGLAVFLGKDCIPIRSSIPLLQELHYFHIPLLRYRVAAALQQRSISDRRKVVEAVGNSSRHDTFRRRDQIEPELDPLLFMLKELSITRFLTTNYDWEIEKLFQDQGYRRTNYGDTPVNTYPDLNAGQYQDVIFDQKQAGELLRLGVRSRSRDAWIVHMHGRAESNGQGNIIATDRDYRERYTKIDEGRPLIDESIRCAFSAAPLMFVGIGMEEGDLLRPLRQFMSAPNLVGDRLVVALLPLGTTNPNDIERQKIEFLHSYGIYTIHYGWSASGTPWLAQVKDFRNQLLKLYECFVDPALVLPITQGPHDRWSDFKLKLEQAAPKLIPMTVPSSIDETFLSLHSIIKTLVVTCTGELNTALEYANSQLARIRNSELVPPHVETKFSSEISLEEWASIRRTFQAHRVLINGATNALTTAALCARLVSLKQQWLEWRNDFTQLPRPREIQSKATGPYILSRKGDSDNIVLEIKVTFISRHEIALPSVDNVERTMERFYSGAPSQTFDTLMASVLRFSSIKSQSDGRRIFLFLSQRGAGKGHFFAALQPDTVGNALTGRLAEFLGATLPNDTREARVALFNLSFSVEITSIFDRMSEFLWAGVSIEGSSGSEKREEEDRNWRRLEGDRIQRLRYALRTLRQRCFARGRRFVIAMNALDVMFDGNGNPKNQQLGDLFGALTDNTYSDAPVDFIFVCSTRAVPLVWRYQAASGVEQEGGLFFHLKRPGISARGEAQVDRVVREIGLSVDVATSPKGDLFVHVLHQVRPSSVLCAFFPSVALMLARHIIAENDEGRVIKNHFGRFWNISPNLIQPNRAQTIRAKLKHFLGILSDDRRNIILSNAQVQKFALPLIIVAAAILFDMGVKSENDEEFNWDMGQLVTNLFSMRPNPTYDELVEFLAHIICNYASKAWGEGCGADTAIFSERVLHLKSSLISSALKFDERVRGYHLAVSGRRYAFTLLMAVAYDIIRSGTPSGLCIQWSVEGDELDKAAARAISCLDNNCAELERYVSRRDDVVITEALRQYKYQHECLCVTPVEWALDDMRRGPELFQLQEWLLWHLGVIGIPVEADLLARCPLVRAAVDRTAPRLADGQLLKPDEKKYEIRVSGALELLVTRCLAFKITPVDGGDSFRFGIHRTVQRHIFYRMGAPFVEYTEVDQFSITLYASQENDIPRLSLDWHLRLQRTVYALSGNPESAEDAEIYETRNDELRSRMLRAAYGILRSIYSVASLARFGLGGHVLRGADNVGGDFSGSPGVFELHRRQVRWLLNEAAKLPHDVRSPFYAEECVWLCNECGVLSLVQGRLPDAIALFQLADKAARAMEGGRTGPVRMLIQLNRSVADIERGRLNSAERNLSRIVAIGEGSVKNEAKLIAKGYLALIQHLRGQFKRARSGYDKTIRKLVGMRKSRAASIFSRHYSDLLRHHGTEGRSESHQEIASAIRLSGEGRHDDTLNLALLAEARGILVDSTTTDSKRIYSILSEVEDYARVMGMPRLSAEIEEIRARLHRRNGDLRSASTAASNCLEIAAGHELVLRKASGLVLLGDVYRAQGIEDASRALIEEGWELAEEVGYDAAAVAARAAHQKLKGTSARE